MTDGHANTLTMHDYQPATATMRGDVLRGLMQDPKMLPSQYLYDERGARLFEKICETEEYYLTRTEIAILRRNMDALTGHIGPGALVIEPGCGSGVKTRLLLENLESPVGYVPIDIAKKQLGECAAHVARCFPDLNVVPVCADFTNGCELPRCGDDVRKRVTYFPGSTIGNFTPPVAVEMLRHMGDLCDNDGGVLIGVDLKKDRTVVEAAYDDAEGVSREFALNYLVRLNRELGADFVIDQFGYEAPYNDIHGRIEMALVSRRRQIAQVDGTDVGFDAGERVLTEYSYKYSSDEFAALAEKAGLTVVEFWTDPRQLFSVQYLSSS